MEDIPTSRRRKGPTPFRVLPWALGTQELGRSRCLVCPQATSTPLLVLDRSISTSRIQIRPWALQRFCLIPPATATQPSEQPRLNLTTVVPSIRPMGFSRFSAISTAATTPPRVTVRCIAISPARATLLTVTLRSITTQPAPVTRQLALRHSLATRLAVTISPWALLQADFSPGAITISISATTPGQGRRGPRATPSESATTLSPPHTSQETAGLQPLAARRYL